MTTVDGRRVTPEVTLRSTEDHLTKDDRESAKTGSSISEKFNNINISMCVKMQCICLFILQH